MLKLVIVGNSLFTVNNAVILPDVSHAVCVAVMVQKPTLTMVTMIPEMVATEALLLV